MTIQRRAAAPVAFCLSIGLLCAPTARAELIERVSAVVNDRAILLSDLRRHAAPLLEQALQDASNTAERKARVKVLYERLLQQLVDEELIEQAAAKAHIGVSTLDVDQAIENVQRQNKLSDADFWNAVRGQGFTEKQYREDVRKQLLRLKVINQRVRSHVNITEQTVKDAYDDRLRNARRALRFHAEHVFIALSATATATDVAEALKTAKALRATLTPSNFDAVAEKQGGGDLGWLDQGDLPAVLEETLLGLSEGQMSAPVRGPAGVHIFLLRERQSGANTLPPFEQARVELQRELLDKAMQRQEDIFIKGLRREAVVEVRNQ
jgi:peptidyl-prolyl cis-trans isomerase SurA